VPVAQKAPVSFHQTLRQLHWLLKRLLSRR
jgi:hypothetical protein